MTTKSVLKRAFIAAGNLYFGEKPRVGIPARPGKILIFTRKSIGDIIMAVPAFRALRQTYPNSRISLWTMDWNREVIRPLDFFDEVVFLSDDILMHRDFAGLAGLIRRMRKERYDMAVCLDSFMFPLYCRLAGIPVRVGYETGREGFALTHRVRISDADYRLDNFLKVAGAAGAYACGREMRYPVKTAGTDKARVNELLPPELMARFPAIVGAAVGGGRNPGQTVPSKNWTRQGYARVLSELIKKDGALVVFFGRGEDQARVREIVRLMDEPGPNVSYGNTVNLVDKTTIAQAAAAIQSCNAFITNDTALMHLAASVGTKTVSIFGPTDPANLAPRGAGHRVVRSSLPCSPCYERSGYKDCGGRCMEAIGWREVYEKAAQALHE